MKHSILALGVIVAAAAHAASARADGAAAVTQLVKDHVAAIAHTHLDDAEAAKTMTASPLIVDGKGAIVAKESDAAVFVQIGTNVDVDYKLNDVVTADLGGGAAWFHAVIAETITWKRGHKTHPTVRMTGVAVDDHGWKIAAVMYAIALPDKTLMARPDATALPAAPASKGERALADAVLGWWKGGLAAAAGDQAVAAGTAPTEAASGKAVAKLAKKWDGLKLVPTAVDARLYANGAIGFARVELALPVTKGKAKGQHVPLVLGVVAVPGGGGWRWVSLQFAFPGVDPYDPMRE